MTLQEKIQKKAEGFGKLTPEFLEGAKFALENQWINIEDDLPCNHEELRHSFYADKTVYVLVVIHRDFRLSRMIKWFDKWIWESYIPTHWMPIPKLPKE